MTSPPSPAHDTQATALRTRPVVAATATIIAVSVVLIPRASGLSMGWAITFAVLFALAELAAVAVGPKHQHRLTITEIPLVLGLVTVGAWSLLVGRVVGSLAASTYLRRGLAKSAFNAALHLLETVVAIRVYLVIADGSWQTAAIAGAAAATIVGIIGVQTMINLHGGRDIESSVRAGMLSCGITVVAASLAVGVLSIGLSVVAMVTIAAAALLVGDALSVGLRRSVSA